jgi:hypothetical protein
VQWAGLDSTEKANSTSPFVLSSRNAATHFIVGAGIVADSVPKKWQETKAAGILLAAERMGG